MERRVNGQTQGKSSCMCSVFFKGIWHIDAALTLTALVLLGLLSSLGLYIYVYADAKIRCSVKKD